MIGKRFEAFLLRLGTLQVRRPWTPFAICAAITALATPGDERIIRKSGCEAYMTKPIRLEQLLNLVDRLLCGGVVQCS